MCVCVLTCVPACKPRYVEHVFGSLWVQRAVHLGAPRWTQWARPALCSAGPARRRKGGSRAWTGHRPGKGRRRAERKPAIGKGKHDPSPVHSILEVEPCGLGWRRFLKMPFVSPALATCCILLQHHANIIVFDTQQQVGSCFA